MSHTPQPHPDFDVGQDRCQSFLYSIPQDLKNQDDTIRQHLANLKAAPKAKLRQIYRLVDKFAKFRDPFVACKRSCSDCCRINVTITSLEAKQLAEASGRPARVITSDIKHDVDQYAGHECPFLVNNLCSVYEHRPYACRQHAMFLPTAEACNPDICYEIQAPFVHFLGMERASREIGSESDRVVADIRDFFPPLKG